MTALHASGLGKRYRQRWALRDCSLQIPQGRVAGLVGPNGAGKTTLLHLAVGLLTPASPRAGPPSWPGSASWPRTPRSTRA
jgi:ABC-2 type transport system ATP-binding protein